jgi:hypothetical protein
LHPAIPPNHTGLSTASLVLSLGFPYDNSLNAMRLIQSGSFDETLDLKLIVAHIGGVIPYLAGRIESYATRSAAFPDAPRLTSPIDHYLRKLYVDTVCYHIEALKCCYRVMGATHMLYGTDHPFGR